MPTKSGNIAVDAIAFSSWSPTVLTPTIVTYSFLDSVPFDARQGDAKGFAPLTPLQQQAVRDALAQWSSVANISFVDVSGIGGNTGQIRFGTNDQNAERSAGYSELPTDGSEGSFVFTYFNNRDPSNFRFTPGSYGTTVFLHEIGHAIGLKHPGDYNGESGNGIGPFLPQDLDTTDYTLMSYIDGASFGINRNNPSTPMLLDILAVQYLYGANTEFRTGNDTYSFTNNSAPQSIWDAGGINTFDFSATTRGASIDLNAGEFSSSAPGLNNISIALGVLITQAIGGTGNDTFFANDAGNSIDGGNGDDFFFLGSGFDNVQGGTGNDTIIFDGIKENYLITRANGGFTIQELGGGNNIDFVVGVETLRFSNLSISTASIGSGTAPTLTNPLQDIYAGVGKAFTLQVPATAFADVDVGDSLRFSASQVNGNALPNWLNFNSATGTFSGTPDAANTGNLFVRVTATDNANLAVSSDFHITTVKDYGQQFANTASNDIFLGTSALDNAVYSGNRADYTIRATGNNGFTISQAGGGTDTLQNVDRVRFADASVALDISGNGGMVYGLYQAALGRSPDPAGLGFWMNALDGGFPMLSVVRSFIDSPEFFNTYSKLDTSGFVELLYLNVLKRPSDPGGAAFFKSAIDAGLSGRDETLFFFMQSTEFQGNLAKVIGDGFSYTPFLS
jgi:Putative Ig domain/Domain of unknown function (DUF4214)/Peptidase M10 serralysin C terminal